MKCYKCNGTGYYDIDNECPVCDGTGEYEPFDADVELDKLDDIKVPPFTDGQKQLIEMTEKLAEKRGGKICDVDGIDDDITDIKELLNDTIKRIEEPTNYDWLHSLNTEQLADVFFEYRYINATPQQQLWLSANEDFVKGGIVEWLKQPHTVKE